MRKPFLLLGVALFICLNAFADGPLLMTFPEGKGRAVVQTTCTRCHAPLMVLQNRMDRAGWDAIITRMQVKNGLGKLEPSVRKQILDYLEAQLSPKTAKSSMDGDLGPRPVNPLPKT